VLLRGYSGRAQDVLRCDQGWIEGADVAEFLAGKRGACRFGPAAGRLLLLVLVAAVMTGCAAPARTGPTLDAVTRTVGTPKPGQARVIVLRDKAFAGIIDAGWQVHLDGVPMGDLKTGTFVYRDRPAGHHQLTFARAGDLARVSRHDFDVAPGRTYVFRIELNEKGKLVAGGSSQGGVLPLLVTSAIAHAADERGLYDFIPLDEPAAQQALAELRLAE